MGYEGTVMSQGTKKSMPVGSPRKYSRRINASDKAPNNSLSETCTGARAQMRLEGNFRERFWKFPSSGKGGQHWVHHGGILAAPWFGCVRAPRVCARTPLNASHMPRYM